MENMFVIATILLFGLIVGSFLSVCIFRLPLSRLEPEPGEPPITISFTVPRRSVCPCCERQLLWWHNIPCLSWVLLRGRCSFCQAPISARYPVVELLSALMALLSYYYFGLSLTALVIYALCASLIVVSFIDYDYYIIPDELSKGGTLVSLILVALNHYFNIFSYPISPDIWTAGWGVLSGAGFLYVVMKGYVLLRKKEGLGFGDVKLLAFVGVLLGPEGALATIFGGSLLGSVFGLLLIVLTRRPADKHLPFGPYLCLATVIYVFWGRGMLVPAGFFGM